MKKIFRTWLTVLTCTMVLAACSDKKSSTNGSDDKDKQELADDEVSDDEDFDVEDEILADIDLDQDLGDDELTPEESEAYENEVWPHLGGQYFFFAEEQQAMLSIDPESPTKGYLNIGDEELECAIDQETGFFTATDGEGHVAFSGALYAGGNLLKGTYRGKEVKFWGSGD